MGEPVTITLSHDEALVLFECLARWRFGEDERPTLRNNAEYLALVRIAAQLDKLLVAPFMQEYGEILEQARRRLAGDNEGIAPGVEPD
ncbi:MAG TPA: hypothetical protein VK434_06795 [Microvirga sp.]|jgi:hypothetical protein|nr:hypothetical protein [Microvirga sp.]